LYAKLKEEIQHIICLHSGHNFDEINSRFDCLKSRTYSFIITSDILERGLNDYWENRTIINYELPLNPRDYIHRIGRNCGIRYGSNFFYYLIETIINLVSPEQMKIFDSIID